MAKISVVVVDDERLCRKRIVDLLAEDQGFAVVAESANGQEAVEAIVRLQPDVVFLDIQMPQVDGFGVLQRAFGVKAPLVIFVTAYNEYAVKAFEIHAFDYLLKPFDRLRFRTALDRIRSAVRERQTGELQERLTLLLESLNGRRRGFDRLAVKNNGHVVLVKMQNIDWIEAADNYVCLHCGAETHTMRDTMNAIESRLDPARFLRIHRSTIVNLDRIKALQPWFRGDYLVIMNDGTELTLSRGYRERMKATLLRNA